MGSLTDEEKRARDYAIKRMDDLDEQMSVSIHLKNRRLYNLQMQEQNELNQLVKEFEARENTPDEPTAEDACIWFQLRFVANGPLWTYAAIRTPGPSDRIPGFKGLTEGYDDEGHRRKHMGVWYTTGKVNKGPYTWQQLWHWITTKSFYRVYNLTGIGELLAEEDRTVRTNGGLIYKSSLSESEQGGYYDPTDYRS